MPAPPDRTGSVALGDVAQPDTEETDALRAAEESTRSFSRVPAWLRGEGAATPAEREDASPRPSKLASWLRGGRPLEGAVADAEPVGNGTAALDRTRRDTKIPAWLRGGEMGEGPGAARVAEPADESYDDDDAATAADESPDDEVAATAEAEPDELTPEPGDAGARWSGEALAPPAGESEPAASRAPAWLRVDPDTLNGLRDKLLGRREAQEDDPYAVPALPPPIRTRTDARLRGNASVAAHRNPTELWTLRIVAAIVVVVLLTAFVLLLAYLA
jgi:hypothetical protein